MSQVLFYIHSEDTSAATAQVSLPQHFVQACQLASYYYQQNKKVFIYTENQQDAFTVDEYLWQFDGDSFVPHNLSGEGPKQGSAVEISSQAPQGRRPVLINLTSTMPDFASQFQFIVDFVPSDETLKQQARDRFIACRQWGFQVDNQAVTEPQ